MGNRAVSMVEPPRTRWETLPEPSTPVDYLYGNTRTAVAANCYRTCTRTGRTLPSSPSALAHRWAIFLLNPSGVAVLPREIGIGLFFLSGYSVQLLYARHTIDTFHRISSSSTRTARAVEWYRMRARIDRTQAIIAEPTRSPLCLPNRR